VLVAPCTISRIIVCGGWGGTNVAYSLFHAGEQLANTEMLFCNADLSNSRLRLMNKLAWYYDRATPHPERLERRIEDASVGPGTLVITTGLTHVRAAFIQKLKQSGCIFAHYSTDDPWNLFHRARWHHAALLEYDLVYTPRTSNIEQFRTLGCPNVKLMRFGFDERLFPDTAVDNSEVQAADALFVGGADQERAAFFEAFKAAGGNPTIVGGYWDRWSKLKENWIGHLPPNALLALTLRASVNIILVKHSNRDGHTMRTIEAGAIGCCMIVEDTPDHRDLFGNDGAAVRYFRNPTQAASIIQELMPDHVERARMAKAVKTLVRETGQSYLHRLTTMLNDANEIFANAS